MEYETLYEDPDLVVISKPEGISVIPERSGTAPCILARFQEQYTEKLFVVHRLDKEVSGVLLFAKNADSHRNLCLQFEKREVSKKYTALVHGRVNDDFGVIDKPLREFGSGRMGVDSRRGKPSRTEFRTKQRIGNKWTLLSLYPTTGRRHQLRVHLYSIDHAIVGDLRYGEKELQGQFPRLMLHASELSFVSMDGSTRTIIAPEPKSFREVLRRIREDEWG